MAWESRRNGKKYFYRKRRVNGRVVSEYIGNGDLAAAFAKLDSLKRLLRLEQQKERNESREQLAGLEAQVTRLDVCVNVLARAGLLAAGCRTHKGQWRTGRGRRSETEV